MKRVALFIGGLIFILSSCAKDPVPVDPGIATLISPADNETCLDGTPINDTQSNVNFSWSEATNAVSYEVVVTNLLTQSSQTFTAASNQTTVALTKAEPYSWLVKSIGETSTTAAESSSWKFYLAGDAIINYAPFPSELTSPRSGANVTPGVNNLIILRWNASDVDGDLVQFEVYLDQNDASTRIETIDYQEEQTSLELEVENNVTYYWKIIAIDDSGNQSSSGGYSFRTN